LFGSVPEAELAHAQEDVQGARQASTLTRLLAKERIKEHTTTAFLHHFLVCTNTL
jgi:hypothetical protein